MSSSSSAHSGEDTDTEDSDGSDGPSAEENSFRQEYAGFSMELSQVTSTSATLSITADEDTSIETDWIYRLEMKDGDQWKPAELIPLAEDGEVRRMNEHMMIWEKDEKGQPSFGQDQDLAVGIEKGQTLRFEENWDQYTGPLDSGKHWRLVKQLSVNGQKGEFAIEFTP